MSWHLPARSQMPLAWLYADYLCNRPAQRSSNESEELVSLLSEQVGVYVHVKVAFRALSCLSHACCPAKELSHCNKGRLCCLLKGLSTGW